MPNMVNHLKDHISEIIKLLRNHDISPEQIKAFSEASTSIKRGNLKLPNLAAMRQLAASLPDEDLFSIISAYLDACEHIVRDSIDIVAMQTKPIINRCKNYAPRDVIDRAHYIIENIFAVCQDPNTNANDITTAINALKEIAEHFPQNGIITVMSNANYILRLTKILGAQEV